MEKKDIIKGQADKIVCFLNRYFTKMETKKTVKEEI